MGGEDEKGSVVERWVLAKFTLRFVAAVSFFSFLYSYFSGLWSYNVQFSTLIFSLFAHSLDRKYVFLICNGIVAFLVKNLSFSSSSSSSSASAFIKSAEDNVTDVSAVLVEENAASSSVEYGEEEEEEEEETEKQRQEMKVQEEDEDEVGESIGEEKEINIEVKEAEDELDEDKEEVVEEENKGREEETEELNHKFEEFIRKMKEEIRIEAQQQQQQLLVAV